MFRINLFYNPYINPIIVKRRPPTRNAHIRRSCPPAYKIIPYIQHNMAPIDPTVLNLLMVKHLPLTVPFERIATTLQLT